MTRVAIVGAGAMGGLWAARLGAADHDVTVIDVSTELVGAIRSQGLVLQGSGGEVVRTTPAATTDPLEAGPQDLVFVFVKGPHTAAAAAGLAPLITPTTQVATLQNGWGNADVLARTVPPGQLVIGVTYHAATIVASGRISHGGTGPSTIGPYQDGASLEPAEMVARVMRSGGFEVEVSESRKTAIWRKLIHNAACLPVSALTDLPTAPLVEPGSVRDLIDDLAREAVAVARAAGHDIDADERIERIHAVLAAAGMGIPSMLADVRARRPTEIATINGAIVRAGREVGVPTPLNEAMVALLAGLERSWSAAPPRS